MVAESRSSIITRELAILRPDVYAMSGDFLAKLFPLLFDHQVSEAAALAAGS